MPLSPGSPDALAPLASACASPVIALATISPPKRETAVTAAAASDAGAPSRCASDETLTVVEPALTTEPSDGYANAPPGR